MKTIWSLILIFAMMIAASAAFAQITNISPELTSGQPILETPEVKLRVGPRFWYLWSTSGIAKPTTPSSVATNSFISFPMAGGTLGASLRALPDTTFVLSAIYGTSTISNDALFVNPNPATVTSQRTTSDIKRLDVEFLGLTSISDGPWAWIWGGRFEHNDVNSNILATSATATPLVVGGPVSTKVQGTGNFYTIKGGISGAVPISASGDLRLFGNIMLLGGVYSVTGTGALPGVVGPDLSVGFQYVFSPTIVADIRYRGLVQFLVGAPKGKGYAEYTVQQGPLVGLTFKF